MRNANIVGMNRIMDHHIRLARRTLREQPDADLSNHWRQALLQLITHSLSDNSISRSMSIEELKQRSLGKPWSYEQFFDRVTAPQRN